MDVGVRCERWRDCCGASGSDGELSITRVLALMLHLWHVNDECLLVTLPLNQSEGVAY